MLNSILAENLFKMYVKLYKYFATFFKLIEENAKAYSILHLLMM